MESIFLADTTSLGSGLDEGGNILSIQLGLALPDGLNAPVEGACRAGKAELAADQSVLLLLLLLLLLLNMVYCLRRSGGSGHTAVCRVRWQLRGVCLLQTELPHLLPLQGPLFEE